MRPVPYILVDATGQYVWCGPGLRSLDDLQSAPHYAGADQAQTAADALHRAIGLTLRPVRAYLSYSEAEQAALGTVLQPVPVRLR